MVFPVASLEIISVDESVVSSELFLVVEPYVVEVDSSSSVEPSPGTVDPVSAASDEASVTAPSVLSGRAAVVLSTLDLLSIEGISDEVSSAHL